MKMGKSVRPKTKKKKKKEKRNHQWPMRFSIWILAILKGLNGGMKGANEMVKMKNKRRKHRHGNDEPAGEKLVEECVSFLGDQRLFGDNSKGGHGPLALSPSRPRSSFVFGSSTGSGRREQKEPVTYQHQRRCYSQHKREKGN